MLKPLFLAYRHLYFNFQWFIGEGRPTDRLFLHIIALNVHPHIPTVQFMCTDLNDKISLFYLALGRDEEFCNRHVCMSVCISVCLSVSMSLKSTCLNFTKFSVHIVCHHDSVILQQKMQYVSYCYPIIIHIMARERWWKWTYFQSDSPMGSWRIRCSRKSDLPEGSTGGKVCCMMDCLLWTEKGSYPARIDYWVFSYYWC